MAYRFEASTYLLSIILLVIQPSRRPCLSFNDKPLQIIGDALGDPRYLWSAKPKSITSPLQTKSCLLIIPWFYSWGESRHLSLVSQFMTNEMSPFDDAADIRISHCTLLDLCFGSQSQNLLLPTRVQ
ncbi:hypothetical protein L207DRAFT_338935 [Hyaloscypha variabilis F]|uniref:Uncharacterized protein n=1 Tax=Hyaloscypha variabilis (strain UAMH 11265 / GT02V1 / F) TaxID=1149755 RepID=A0A2J6RPM4_HYAVF|nr:hypothetical protein L207DRAFT_338935 [Hyaloscypha variabilis F]